jgi:hypothetical protein
MHTRLTSCALIAVWVSAVALAPVSGAALQVEARLENIAVQGPVSPDGSFAGNLIIEAFTFGKAGQLLLTGVLNGTAIDSTGAKTKVKNQTFTAPATLVDSERTTDMLLLDIAPISLDPLGLQIRLAQITLDIDAISREDNLLSRSSNSWQSRSPGGSPPSIPWGAWPSAL